MKFRTKTFTLSLRDNDHCKRLKDPASSEFYHLEVFLPFTEAAKLEIGNANVRPAVPKRQPYRSMKSTVEMSPRSFHLKNRGITYLCERFEFDNAKKEVAVTIPDSSQVANPDDLPRFGIADGGHTFRVIHETVTDLKSFLEREDWREPYVRVHFVAGDWGEVVEDGEVVEALNTSTQVRQFSLDDYQGEFNELKEALQKAKFDVNLVAWRENDDKEWEVLEIIQRMGCFLKERWEGEEPTVLYKSRLKALDLYKDNKDEFRKLYNVITDVVTLPEFIQSELSGVRLKIRGGLKVVKRIKKEEAREGTPYVTAHEINLAALLPMAAAFRELLYLEGDRYRWKIDPREAFKKCVRQLHQVLVDRTGRVSLAAHLGTDVEYWSACSKIALRFLSREVPKGKLQSVEA